MNEKIPLKLSPKQLKQWLMTESFDPILIDVREEEELNIASLKLSVLHLPLSRSFEWLDTLSQHLCLERPIVVFCHAGIRSLQFGIWLLEQNPKYEVWNLQGGIDAWSQEVDSSIPRY